MQPAIRQVHQQVLELPEGAAGLECLRGRLDGFESLDSFHKDERSPEFAVAPDIV